MPSLDTLQNSDLAEEIEAINAIYDPDTVSINTTPSAATTATLDLGSAGSAAPIASSIKLQLPNHPNLSFIIGFESSYPESRPRVLGTASTGARGEGKLAVDVVEDIVRRIHQPGAVCLFDIINEAVEAFEELNMGCNKEEEEEQKEGEAAATNDLAPEEFATLSLRDSFGIDSPPDWILSEVVTEKKSIFVGRAAHVTSLAQAQAYLDHLLATEKKVAAATHNISAWRIREKRSANNGKGEEEEMIVQDSDDDGETAAGGRLLHLMQLMDVWDVVVVVTRWYGGIHLGPDRFRIINAVGRDALIRGGWDNKKESGGNEKGKKKGKK
ncbi:IMPACT family protein [Aspergillus chevalieri]|uniref:eIF2 kinase Gcn2p negative regulator n=1 Tax=Aspergillus chevalieri TaxID=182096 RepID=A0A7R7VRS9_ASPCH|nr:eIF2 kinase Gcn2p negative regulator [Aspergillus chevalieri]BCR89542.1 eIF2 kinase Gcn2p negative regulator [Aspergillus chevalieri]